MPELLHPSQLDPRLADLTRPEASGFTAGLCRALAERWHVDPLIVRLVAVALVFAGGAGVALYLWGWLLTPRVGGTPPILRWVPAFGRWSNSTQALIVAISSLVLVVNIARQTGIGWGPVIVVGVLAWTMARSRRNRTGTISAPHETPFDPASHAPPAARGTQENVEQWRSRLAHHAGSTLPTVDLYAPETPLQQAQPPVEARHTRSWMVSGAILLLSGVAAVIPVALGLDPALLYSGVAASLTAGFLILLHAVLARSRRLPIALLVLVLAGAVGTGLMSMDSQSDVGIPVAAGLGEDQFHEFLGEAPAELDLTGLEVKDGITIHIDATASVVQILVDDPPGSMEVNSETIVLETSYGSRSQSANDLSIIIDGAFSVVEVEVVP